VNEPSIVAVNTNTNVILATGNEAKKMLGRTPNHVKVVRPLVNGVISDFEMSQEVLKQLLKKIQDKGVLTNYRRAVIGIPSDLTEVERKSVEDAVRGAGVFQTYLIEEPLAAALGARLPVNEPSANMIMDIGGGTTEIAVISMAGMVIARSLKVAGDKLDQDIINFVREEFKLAIGEPTAEEIKIAIGSAGPLTQKLEMTIRGRDLTTGLPKEMTIKDTQVRAAISKSLEAIVEATKEVIESAPPELAGDILRKGITLCGGGSLLRKLDQLLSRELAVAVHMVEDPLTCVARGTGIVVENLEKYEPLLNNPMKPKEINL